MNFSEMTVFQKHTTIEELLDSTIRPELLKDGGVIEVLDIKNATDNTTEVIVSYGGACHDCPASTGGTLNFIENTLRSTLDDGIRVNVLKNTKF